MTGVFVAVGVIGAIALLTGMAYACVSLMRLPSDSRGKTIFWLYGLDQDARAEDHAIDEMVKRSIEKHGA